MKLIKMLPIIFFTLVSCTDQEIYSEYKSFDNQWPLDETLQFVLPQTDSITPYNLFINVRNTNQFEYSNLYMIAAIHFPNGKVVADTLEYEMALPDGSWLGKGNRVKDNKLWYKEQVRFYEEGNYTITLKHAMRNINQVEGVTQLKGITDVGISIEKAVSNN